MIKVVLSIIFISSFIFATSPKELFKKINESKSSLQNANKEKVMTNSQLQKIANKIKKINQEVEIYNNKIDELDKFLSKEQERYNESISELKGIDNMVAALDADINKKKMEFAKILSKQLGSVVAQNKSGEKSEKSVVLKEVYSRYKEFSQQELLKLSKNIAQKKALRENLLQRKKDINKSIADTKLKKKIYAKEKAKRKKLLELLAKEEKGYSKKLKAIFKKQTLIRLTLAKLNIIKQEAAKASKRREKILRNRIKELKRIKFASKKGVNVGSVKQIGSSYQATNIYKYRGAKTISPIKSPKVIKRFGTYIDPVYKIKSHSDSLVLVSGNGDNRVYNVLNGEVVFKGRNAMLGKLVVVKHSNGIYTIYADLNKFSPFIKVGSKVKKGVVIGKVKRKLIFQATKNGAFINPARLVQI